MGDELIAGLAVLVYSLAIILSAWTHDMVGVLLLLVASGLGFILYKVTSVPTTLLLLLWAGWSAVRWFS